MKSFTIRNDFHNTEAIVRVADDGRLTRRQVAHVRKTLCGIADCKCGGPLGERGRQDVEIRYSNSYGEMLIRKLDVSLR